MNPASGPFSSLHRAEISAVIPFFNEEPNVEPVLLELADVLSGMGQSWEILAVDDGSTDGTLRQLLRLRRRIPGLRVLRMRRNGGQTAAMQAGFDHARGDRIITLDGDGQNDPTAIPSLMARLDDGYDLVCGWRYDRQDRFLSRKLPSRIANRLIAWVTGVPIHDNGCSLKAYRGALLRRLRLYAEQHRFIPALSARHGARIAEVRVPHRRRRAGRSKYGLSRTYKVMLDLLGVRLLPRLTVSPLLPFGLAGAAPLIAGLAWATISLYPPFRAGVVAPGAGLLLLYLAGYLFLLGLLAELVRVSLGRRPVTPLPPARGPMTLQAPSGREP